MNTPKITISFKKFNANIISHTIDYPGSLLAFSTDGAGFLRVRAGGN